MAMNPLRYNAQHLNGQVTKPMAEKVGPHRSKHRCHSVSCRQVEQVRHGVLRNRVRYRGRLRPRPVVTSVTAPVAHRVIRQRAGHGVHPVALQLASYVAAHVALYRGERRVCRLSLFVAG